MSGMRPVHQWLVLGMIVNAISFMAFSAAAQVTQSLPPLEDDRYEAYLWDFDDGAQGWGHIDHESNWGEGMGFYTRYDQLFYYIPKRQVSSLTFCSSYRSLRYIGFQSPLISVPISGARLEWMENSAGCGSSSAFGRYAFYYWDEDPYEKISSPYDLTRFAGQNIRIHIDMQCWAYCTFSGNLGDGGVYIDNVRISGLLPVEPPAVDSDDDGVSDDFDNCPFLANANQTDTDGDLDGDTCDTDDDNDSFTDAEEIAAGSDPLDANSFPIPEPTSVLLQLTALLTLAGLRRRAH